MKKFLLSFFVIISFAAYAVYQRVGGSVVGPQAGPRAGVVPTTPRTPIAVVAKQKAVVAKTATTPASVGKFKNGTYTGSVADAYYGNVQVQAIIQDGKLADVQFLNYPQDRNNSIRINTRAIPILTSEAIQAQSAQVDMVSGATATSGAFQQSLADALSQAQV